jgi:hypothetical protein
MNRIDSPALPPLSEKEVAFVQAVHRRTVRARLSTAGPFPPTGCPLTWLRDRRARHTPVLSTVKENT